MWEFLSFSYQNELFYLWFETTLKKRMFHVKRDDDWLAFGCDWVSYAIYEDKPD